MAVSEVIMDNEIAGKKLSVIRELNRMNKMIALVVVLLMLYSSMLSGCFLFDGGDKKADEYYELGLQAVRGGKDAEAIIYFKNTLKKKPSHAKARLELGLSYLRQSQIPFATRELSLAAGSKETLEDASRALAQIYMQTGEYSRAIPLLEAVLANAAPGLHDFLMLGECLLAVRRPGEALVVLKKAEENYPKSAFPPVHIARALLLEGKEEDARVKIEEALGLEPGNLEVRLLAGSFYEKASDTAEAEKVFRKANSDFPSDALSWISLARFLHRVKEKADAEAVLKQALKAGIKDPSILHLLAITYHLKKDFDSALKTFKDASDQFPDDWRSMILLGDYYLVLKRIAEAKITYEKVAERWPQLVPVRSKIAEVLIAERKYEKARQHVEAILKDDSRYARARILRGILLLTEGNISEAREDFLRAKEIIPRSPDARFLYGMTFLEEGRYDLSLSELMEALEVSPASLNVRIALSYVYFKTGRPGAAIDELSRVIESQPDNERALMLRAQAFRLTRQFEKAEADYMKVIEMMPELSLPRIRLAETYMAMGAAAKAAETLEQLSDGAAADTRVLELTVRAYVTDGRYDEAMRILDGRGKSKPDLIAIPILKAGVLLRKGDFETAEAILKELRKSHPSSITPCLVLARAYLNRTDYDRATQTYLEALSLEPGNTDALCGKARANYLAGRTDEAIAAYEEVLAINESLAPAANDLAYIYAESDREIERAMGLASRAKEMQPRNPDILDTMGWVQFKKGLIAHAEKNIKEALGRRSSEPLFHYHLGSLYYKTGRYNEATAFFKEAVRLGLAEKEAGDAEVKIERMKKMASDMEMAKRYEEKGEISKAVGAYERVLKEGFHWRAADALASLYADNKENLDRALLLARQASEAFPENSHLAGTMGWVLFKKGVRASAGRYLSQAVVGDPDNSLSHYRLGVFHYEGKAYSEASKEIEKALSLGLAGKPADNASTILKDIKKQESDD